MSQTVLITVTSIGVDNSSTFNIYSDLDNYVYPFETSISASSLYAGYTSNNVPDGTLRIKVKSTSGVCDYEPIGGMLISVIPQPSHTPTPTPTITPTPTATPTVTPTPTPTPTVTPTPTATPIPELPIIITSGLTIFVDGSGSSYPGYGSYWFNRVTGTTITGATLNGSPGPTWNTSTNGFFTFDGVDDYGNFGQASTGTTTGSTTFGGWVNMTTGATKEVIFQRGYGSSWSLQLYKSIYNTFTFSIVAGSSIPTQFDCPAPSVLISNTWYYVVAKRTSSPNQIKLYINGVLVETTNVTVSPLRSNGTEGWYIGIDGTTFDVANVGDFEVYDRALSDAEVLSNFNTKKTLYGY